METKQIRQQENKFLPFIKSVIDYSLPNITKGNFNVKLSTDYEDSKLSFDAIYSTDIEISIRLRTYSYINYNDFTIRYRSNSGIETEIDKLIDGKGNLYFYGFLNEQQTEPIKWILFDINKIRNKLLTTGYIRNNRFDLTQLKVYSFDFLKENNAIISYGWNYGKRILRLDKKLNWK